MKKAKPVHSTIKLNLPISCHWSLSIRPENIRKPEAFQCFQGVQKILVV